MKTISKIVLRNRTITFLILGLLVIIAYINSLPNALVVDDATSINNPRLHSISMIADYKLSFIQPLLYFFTINLFGPNATMFRVVNILFHIGTVWMIYVLVSRLSNRTTAFLTSALFAVHPVLVESVSWVSGGPHVIYSFFLICSLYLYIISSKKKKLYFLSLLFFLLALFTSTKASVFPLVVLSYEIFLGDLKKNWLKIIPFFGFVSIFAILSYFPQIGARILDMRQDANSTPLVYNVFVLVPYSIFSYMALIFWPIKLSIYHPNFPLGVSTFAVNVVGNIALLGLAIYSFFKNRLILFFISLFVIGIMFTFSPLNLFWVVAERYVYFGSLGLIFLFGYGLDVLVKNKKTEILGWFIFFTLLFLLMSRTIVRNLDWKNELSLWQATINSYPDYYQSHYSLGVVYEESGDLINARKEYELSIKLNSANPKSYANLGSTALKTNDFDRALPALEKAVALDPTIWEPYQNIAVVYYAKKSYDKAIYYTEEAIKRVPEQSDRYVFAVSELYFNLGSIYYEKKDRVKAREYLLKAAELNPKNERVNRTLNDETLWN